MDLLQVIAGAVVGFTIGLTGVGGGSLMTPILVLGFGIPAVIAVGTDLLYAAITKCGGVYFHSKQATVDWGIVKLLAKGSIPASIITIILLQRLNQLGLDYQVLMTSTLGIMLILTSIVVISKDRLLDFVKQNLGNQHPCRRFVADYRPAITTVAGLLLGILVTISSVGAGAIGAAILFLLYPGKKSITIVGTDIAHAVPLTAIAGLGHLHFGSVDFQLLSGLLLGGLPAIYLGSLLGQHLPDRILKPIVASILMIMGLRFIL